MWLLFALLSTLMWALVNVLDSLIVRNYEKNPFVLMWCQSFFTMVFLVLFPMVVPVGVSSWIESLMLFGAIGFLGDIWFFRVLRSVDVSVTNAAWAILSVFLSIAGFFVFQESLTASQFAGSTLVIGGVLFLSFFHHSTDVKRTLWFLVSLALLFTPFYIMKKAAIDADLSVVHVFYWMMLGRELCAFNVPWFMPSVRRSALKILRSGWSFSLFNGAVVLCFLLAELFATYTYKIGTISLVAIVWNVQPFIVIGLAWLFVQLLPSRAPRELLTKQSVRVKFFSFLIVFGGLALLAAN